MKNPCEELCPHIETPFGEACNDCLYAQEVHKRQLLEYKMTTALAEVDSIIVHYRTQLAEKGEL